MSDPIVGDVHGLPLTPQLLAALGCGRHARGLWTLTAGGYEFRFVAPRDGGAWTFCVPGDPHGHSVTHLGECLGFIAQDFYDEGLKDKLAQVRDALGLGGDVGKPAKVVTPEGDPS